MLRRLLKQRLLIVGAVLGVVVALAIPMAIAANYHFVGSQSCTQSTSGTSTTLTCSFSVAGLGNATSATAYIAAPYNCQKTNNGQQYVQPGGLAKSPTQTYSVRNGRIDVTNLSLTASCPDQFHPVFTGPVSVYVNNTLVGTIAIT